MSTRLGSTYRRLDITREYEPYEVQHRARRENPAQSFMYKGRRFILKCGTSDWACVWSFDGGRRLIATSVSPKYGYAGIEEFQYEDGLTQAMIRKQEGTGESHASAFFQNVNEELAEYVRGDFFDYSEAWQRDTMIPYL